MVSPAIFPGPTNQVKTGQFIECELYCGLDYVRQCGGKALQKLHRLENMVRNEWAKKKKKKETYKIYF